MTKPYSHAQWKKFRQELIELDGNRCCRCNRGSDGTVVLQVHHKHYIRQKLPWEYDYADCETLCKGCHAAEHGHIPPKTGWDYLSEDDLGSLCGSCELCGNDIRYVYYIHHPQWEPMGVGTICCDNLTGTKIASHHTDANNRRHSREETFINSNRWITLAGTARIKQKGIVVDIIKQPAGFQIRMNGAYGKQIFQTINLAKKKAFEAIESGKAEKYLNSRYKNRR